MAEVEVWTSVGLVLALECTRVEGYLLALQFLGCIDTSLMCMSMHLKFSWYGSYWGLDWYETGITMGHTSLISSFFIPDHHLWYKTKSSITNLLLCFGGRISNQEFKRNLEGSWSDLGIVVVADNLEYKSFPFLNTHQTIKNNHHGMLPMEWYFAHPVLCTKWSN